MASYLELLCVFLLLGLYAMWLVTGLWLAYRVKKLEDFVKQWQTSETNVMDLCPGLEGMRRSRFSTLILGKTGLLSVLVLASFGFSSLWSILVVLPVFFAATWLYNNNARNNPIDEF